MHQKYHKTNNKNYYEQYSKAVYRDRYTYDIPTLVHDKKHNLIGLNMSHVFSLTYPTEAIFLIS